MQIDLVVFIKEFSSTDESWQKTDSPVLHKTLRNNSTEIDLVDESEFRPTERKITAFADRLKHRVANWRCSDVIVSRFLALR